jgi:hypothetical protein
MVVSTGALFSRRCNALLLRLLLFDSLILAVVARGSTSKTEFAHCHGQPGKKINEGMVESVY